MQLHEAQKSIVKDPHRFRVLRAGRRFGKTVLAIEEIVFTAIDREDARIVYVAPTFQAARDIAFDSLKKRVLEIGTKINETRLEMDIPNRHGGYSRVLLRSWDNIETLRGQFFDLIVLDEIAHIQNFWVNWQEVLRPTLTDRKGRALFISTPASFNHFYDLCNEELKDKDYRTFHFTSYDNPFLPKDELDTAKATLPPERFAQEYLADFQKTQGLVYKEFSREKHLYDELPSGEYKKVAGIDFGFIHPAAVIEIRYSKREGIFYVENEWYKTNRTDLQIAEYVAMAGYDEVYPDPESPGAIEELKRQRVNVREVVKGKDSVLAGIDKIRELLIANRLKINKHCINLLSEIEMYSYEEGSEKPVKENDHALDALRYAIYMLYVPKRKPIIADDPWGDLAWRIRRTEILREPENPAI